MCLRKRSGFRPGPGPEPGPGPGSDPDRIHDRIYTGPIPAQPAMGGRRGHDSTGGGRSFNSQRQPANACCFCWCCCCSCSWNEDERQKRRRKKRISQDTKMELIPNCEACTKPTADEVRVWSQSFERLLRNPAGRNVFREFLRTEYSEENLLFWLACEDLKQERNQDQVEEKVRCIYEDFVSILSPREVSLDARVREVINKKIQDPTPQTFEDAQLQIYTLMHRDSYPRFLSSSIYKALLQSQS